MKPWDRVRREVTGAWRSVRYDLDHRSKAGVESKSAPIGGETGGWRSRPQPERQSIWAPLRDPHRLLATFAVASVVAASATGTFFAVTGGLGILLVDSPGASAAPQTAPASAPPVVSSPTPRQRQVPASRPPSPSPSALVRVSPTPTARPTSAVKPSPSAALTRVPPSLSPVPESTPSAPNSHTLSPNASPAASAAP